MAKIFKGKYKVLDRNAYVQFSGYSRLTMIERSHSLTSPDVIVQAYFTHYFLGTLFPFNGK